MKLGLEAMDAVCARLGGPERRFPTVLVGGTNGKGSTAATLAAIATCAGLKTGLYTSPHLIDVTERIRLGWKDVEADYLDGGLEAVFAAADEAPAVPLTYFEAMTAAALFIFADWKAELAVLEVGLGGRLDATNIADPILSIVTSIGLDHTADLGPTLESIAREKAGIFRWRKPALVRVANEEARTALGEASDAAGAYWYDLDRETEITRLETGLAGTRFGLATPVRMYALETPLPGAHQAGNAALAVRAAELLAKEMPRLTAVACLTGVRSVFWPGRLESFRVSGRTVVLDGCHNPEGASALARFLGDAGLDGRTHLVFGAMADKDIEGIAAEVFPRVRSVTLVPAGTARGEPAERLARRVEGIGPASAAGESLAAALDGLLASSGSETIIVAGSLYLVGEARRLLLSGKYETTTQ
jgi:dihydrofolate synthase/folylpolyglutamate synthase